MNVTVFIKLIDIVASSLSTIPSLTLNLKLSPLADWFVLLYITLVPDIVFGKSSVAISDPFSIKVPSLGRETIIYFKGSLFSSDPLNVIVLFSPGKIFRSWSSATGASLSMRIEIEIFAILLSTSPSFNLKLNSSVSVPSTVLVYLIVLDCNVFGKSSLVIWVSPSFKFPFVGSAVMI